MKTRSVPKLVVFPSVLITTPFVLLEERAGGGGEERRRGGTIHVCEIFGLPPFAIEMSAKHFPWRLIFNLNEAHGILSILKT